MLQLLPILQRVQLHPLRNLRRDTFAVYVRMKATTRELALLRGGAGVIDDAVQDPEVGPVAERPPHRLQVGRSRALVDSGRHGVGIDPAQVHAPGQSDRHHLVGPARHPDAHRVKELIVHDLDAVLPQSPLESET